MWLKIIANALWKTQIHIYTHICMYVCIYVWISVCERCSIFKNNNNWNGKNLFNIHSFCHIVCLTYTHTYLYKYLLICMFVFLYVFLTFALVYLFVGAYFPDDSVNCQYFVFAVDFLNAQITAICTVHSHTHTHTHTHTH